MRLSEPRVRHLKGRLRWQGCHPLSLKFSSREVVSLFKDRGQRGEEALARGRFK